MSDYRKDTYGLMIRRDNKYGTEYVIAELVKREDGSASPRGASDSFMWERPKHLVGVALEHLTLDTFVSEFNSEIHTPEACYRDVYSVRERDAVHMAKTLAKVNKRMREDAAHTPEDCLVSLCKALKLSFVVERVGPLRGSSYSDNEWNWMSIGEGRNRFRELAAEAVEAAKKAKAAA